MSDSYSERFYDMKDYKNICDALDIKRKDDIDYDHFRELKSLPFVYFENGQYKVDKANYPEYFL